MAPMYGYPMYPTPFPPSSPFPPHNDTLDRVEDGTQTLHFDAHGADTANQAC